MRIGLTGADGVLGRRISVALERRGYAVEPFAGDVRELSEVMSWAGACDQLVHAAAVVPTGEVEAAPGSAIAVNVGGAAHVAKAASRLGRHLTYVSTSHVYGAHSSPLRETDPTQPSTFYGLTKLQGEQCVRFLATRHLIARVFSFFDQHQLPPFLAPSLRDRIFSAPEGAELDLRGATHVRDMADAEWIAEVVARLVAKAECGTVNCGTGRGLSVREIAETMAQVLGRSDVTWKPAADGSDTKLVADTHELCLRIGDLPEFSLAEAMSRAFAPDASREPHG